MRSWWCRAVPIPFPIPPLQKKKNVSTVYFILIIVIFFFIHQHWQLADCRSVGGSTRNLGGRCWDAVHGLTREYEFMTLLGVFCLISKRAWQGFLMQFPEHWWNILRISVSSTFVPCKYWSYYLFHCNLQTSHGCTLKSYSLIPRNGLRDSGTE